MPGFDSFMIGVQKMAKTTVYAVRDSETKERLSYRYRDYSEALQRMAELRFNGRPMEVYRTTQDLPKRAK